MPHRPAFRLLRAVLLIGLVGSDSLSAQQPTPPVWRIEGSASSLSRCKIETVGICGGVQFPVIIEIQHAAGNNDTFSLNIRIPSFQRASSFDFSDFYDPWESNSSVRFLTVLPKHGKCFKFIAGGVFIASDEFVFENSSLKKSRGSMLMKLLNVASKNDDEWTIKIGNKIKTNPPLVISFSFRGAHDFLLHQLK